MEEVPVDADVVGDEVGTVNELRVVAAAPDGTARRFGGYLQTEWKDGFAVTRLFIRDGTLIERQAAIAWPQPPRSTKPVHVGARPCACAASYSPPVRKDLPYERHRRHHSDAHRTRRPSHRRRHATIALVYGRGASHRKATGELLRTREDVWIEVVDEHDRISYIGLRAAVFDSAEGQALLADWRHHPGWRVAVWDGRELWPGRSPGEHSDAVVTGSRL